MCIIKTGIKDGYIRKKIISPKNMIRLLMGASDLELPMAYGVF